MNTKLTLKIDKQVIEQAKKYAASQKRSLSKIIESYLKTLAEKEDETKSKIEISPFIKNMSTGVSIPTELDYKTEYSNHILEKHR
ncbi:MAG: hypothetical protein JW761_08870 [Prolixibacteraceae bacterium]|nr:hypothetical protein [Prolixibacteraceae bacterium]